MSTATTQLACCLSTIHTTTACCYVRCGATRLMALQVRCAFSHALGLPASDWSGRVQLQAVHHCLHGWPCSTFVYTRSQQSLNCTDLSRGGIMNVFPKVPVSLSHDSPEEQSVLLWWESQLVAHRMPGQGHWEHYLRTAERIRRWRPWANIEGWRRVACEDDETEIQPLYDKSCIPAVHCWLLSIVIASK